MNYTKIETLAYDLGRYLSHIAPNETNESIVSLAIKFTDTFATGINTDNLQERGNFLYHVGRGYEYGLNQ